MLNTESATKNIPDAPFARKRIRVRDITNVIFPVPRTRNIVKPAKVFSESNYEVDCVDDSPSGWLCQGNIDKTLTEDQIVKLGKRTHRQSELPEGPAVAHRREAKRFRKA